MSKLDTLKCLLGWHSWSRWRKESTNFCGTFEAAGLAPLPGDYKQRRFCQRCGTAQTRPWQGRQRRLREPGPEPGTVVPFGPQPLSPAPVSGKPASGKGGGGLDAGH